MKKPMQKKIICAALAAVFCMAFSLLYIMYSAAFAQKVAVKIGEIASQQLGSRVTVKSVAVKSPWLIEADGICLYDKKNAILAKVKRVDLNLLPWAALRGDVGNCIEKVTLDTPQLNLVQQADKNWNFSFLLEKKTSSKQFSSHFLVKDGYINLQLWQKPKITIEKISGIGKLDASGSFSSDIAFVQGGQKAQLLVTHAGGQTDVNILAAHLNIMPYLKFLPRDILPANFKIKSGKLDDVNLTVRLGKGTPQVFGKAEISQGAFAYDAYAVDKLQGFFIINGKIATFSAQAFINGQKLKTDGAVNFSGKPYFSLVARSDDFVLQKILPSLPLGGKVAFSLVASGYTDNPNLFLTLQSAAGQLGKISYQSFFLQGHGNLQKLYLDTLQVKVARGTLTGQGIVSLKEKTYDGQLKAEHISLGEFSSLLPPKIAFQGGKASFSANFSGQIDDWQKVKFYVSGKMENLHLQGIAVPKADFSLGYAEKNLAIYALKADCVGGKVAVQGNVTPAALSLDVYGSSMDLGFLQKMYKVPLSGQATFFAHLGGSTSNPQVSIELGASDGKLASQPYHRLYLDAEGNLDRIEIKKLNLKNEQNEIVNEVTGFIGFKDGYPLALHVVTKNADVQDLLAAAQIKLPLLGKVDNDLYIKGTLSDFSANGMISLNEGSYHGWLITKASGAYSYRNGSLDLKNIVVHSPFADVQAGGTIKKDGTLNLKIEAHDINLNKFFGEMPCTLSGKADFVGTVTGSLDKPIFQSEMTAKNLAVNGVSLSGASGQCSYHNDVLTLNHFRLWEKESSALVTGNYDLKTRLIQGRMEAQNVDVQSLSAMAGYKNSYLKGRFYGSAELKGAIDSPQIHFHGAIVNGYIKKYPLEHIELDVSYKNHTIAVNKFFGQQGQGKVALAGTWDLNGPLNMVFSTQGLTANFLMNIFNDKINAKGLLNAYAQIGGTAQSPKANISFEIDNGGVGTATFDKMTGLLNYADQVLTVNQILVNKGIYKASLTGKVPLTAIYDTDGQMPLAYQQLDLNLSLENADLSILPFLSPSIEWAMGPLQGNLKVEGTLMHPYFYGYLKMENGAIKIKQLGLPLQDMKLDLLFKRDKMMLNQCSGKMGKGIYSFSGSTFVRNGHLEDYDFRFLAKELDVESKFYKGPLSFQMTLSPGSMYGMKMPLLAGNIDIQNTTLGLPDLNSSGTALPPLALDVSLNLGKNVTFYNPLLFNMEVGGNVHFGGTTYYPQPSGEISAQRGTVSYLQTNFRLQEASAVFNQIGSFLPTLNLKAMARVGQQRINLALSGPAENLHLSLTSNPPLSQEEIVRLLTFQGEAGQGGNVMSDDMVRLAALGLQLGILNELESTVRNTLKLDEFRIVRDDGTFGNMGLGNNLATQKENPANNSFYTVEVGKYVSDKVLLRYRQSINGDKIGYGLQYYFNNNVSILNQWNNQNGYSVFLEANIKF